MPGAMAKGRLANSAIRTVPTIEAMTVAVNTSPPGMPASERMLGFTARI